MGTTQAELLPIYAQLLNTVQVKPAAAVEALKIRDRIVRNLSNYRNIELKVGVPWWFVAGLHYMECDLDFTQHLANGDPIDEPTTNEPKGIPAGTWESCAIAALRVKGWLAKDLDWADALKCLWRAEKWNGWGYRLYHPNTLSPYLWSGTNHYIRGKYVSDGTWNDNAISQQIGVVPIWMALGIIHPAVAPTGNQSVSLSDVSNLGLGHQRGSTRISDLSSSNAGGVKVRPNYLVDVAANYKGLEHQKQALLRLQSNIPEGILDKFSDEYSPQVASGSIATATSAAPKLTTDFANDQYKLLCKYSKNGVANLDTKTNYYSQRDNFTQSHRTCNSSSSAMMVDWWLRASGQPGLSGDDEYLRRLLKVGDSIYHENQTAVIKQYGFNSTWLDSDEPTQADFDRVDGLLDNGFPVVVNISHRGSDRAPSGGHVILLIGRRKSEGTYIAHDPYGTLSSGYTNTNGRFSLISRSSFRARWQGGHRVLV